MTIVETPIRPLVADRRAVQAGVHLVARSYKKGMRLAPHMHREAQLVYAASGTMQVTTPKGRWLVPPDRAVWVPAHHAHAIDMLSDSEMRTIFFDGDLLQGHMRKPRLSKEFVVLVSPLLHHAILALFEDRKDRERADLLVRLAMLELRRTEDSATFIPLPQEPRCRRAADIVLATPAMTHEIETLARKVGTSARTLSRLFAAETKLSFKAWCRRARIATAIERLSTERHLSIKALASDLGYASMPAFSHAFRQVTGKSPTDFVRRL
ncbi:MULTISPECIES: helix-turn-helix transcriptional regulator [unclassified Bradyrhizobium]|uniref:AraC family transcriptional regulator n=1 Tax=unclassified Bradyrhizobium TaxID=2631580 RepID=UPI0028E30046|nr:MULTISPECIES: helix-turn-helix transcriptional regulator [unclassified Bradyrhizobium]